MERTLGDQPVLSSALELLLLLPPRWPSDWTPQCDISLQHLPPLHQHQASLPLRSPLSPGLCSSCSFGLTFGLRYVASAHCRSPAVLPAVCYRDLSPLLCPKRSGCQLLLPPSLLELMDQRKSPKHQQVDEWECWACGATDREGQGKCCSFMLFTSNLSFF